RQLVQMVTELKLTDVKEAKTTNKGSKKKASLENVTSDPTAIEDEELKAVKYANLHRASLTGRLSTIAHKTENRGEYLAAMQQKALIFPATTVFKQVPPWVMAFEVVEASQVFMRTVAKIEPEWIISAAGDLLKYQYFKPHWSKKTGPVKAYAQISLFGLIIISKQLTN